MMKFVISDLFYIIYLIGFVASIFCDKNPMYIVCHYDDFPIYASLTSLIIILDSLLLWGICLYYWHKCDKRRLVFLSIFFLNLFYICWYYIEIRIKTWRTKRTKVSFLCVFIVATFCSCSIDKTSILSKDDLEWQIPSDSSIITAGADVYTIVKISQGERIRRYGILDVRYVNTSYSRLKVINIYGESYLKYDVSKCNGKIAFNLAQNGNVATHQNINDSIICFTFEVIDTVESRIKSLYIQKGVGVINCTTNH